MAAEGPKDLPLSFTYQSIVQGANDASAARPSDEATAAYQQAYDYSHATEINPLPTTQLAEKEYDKYVDLPTSVTSLWTETMVGVPKFFMDGDHGRGAQILAASALREPSGGLFPLRWVSSSTGSSRTIHEFELYLAVEDIDYSAPGPRAGSTELLILR
jgi:hypothetical protein